jgi:translation initiation factor 2-alpha kinase 3
MFRSAADLSSSEPESESDEDGFGEHEASSHERLPNHGVGSRRTSHDRAAGEPSKKINPAASSYSENSLSLEEASIPSLDTIDINADHHANMMTSALLEFYCQSRAADILNAQPGSSKTYTKQSPEAQYLGKKLYKYQSQILSKHGLVTDGAHEEELGATRQEYRDRLDMLGLSALEGLNLVEPGVRSPIEGGEDRELALVSRNVQGIVIPETASPLWPRDGADGNFGRHLPSIGNFDVLDGTAGAPNPSRPLFGSSPVGISLFPQPSVPSLNNMSRYSVEFSELKILGRGSFGEVYHVKNHIDSQDYALKKVPISQRRLDQLQYGGENQLETIMKEIRTLARLEHSNIVRYYGAWVEQAHVSSHRPFEQSAKPRYEPSQEPLSSQGSTNEPSMGIVFENSESSMADSHPNSYPEDQGSSNRIRRWDSHATSSSRHSKKSSVTGWEDDEDIESIPRNFDNHSYGQTSTFGETDDIFTDGLSQDHSKLQVQRQCRPGNQTPAVILHIQMSLHPISLSSYLNPQAAAKYNDTECIPSRRHCFHLMPSLKLFLDIVSGVEYLHSKNIVHRDLKPANIFLSLPQNSKTDTCIPCHSEPNSPSQFCHPRIGDFGLVADISHLNSPASEGTVTPFHRGPNIQRVVGTEFYRPPANTDDSDTPGYFDEYKIDEKLDVFSLGVILFELVYQLNTKMERQLVLNQLTRGSISFPDDFASKVDHGETKLDIGVVVADSLMTCIKGMLCPQSLHRWSCQDVKDQLRQIYKAVKRLETRQSAK